MLQVLYYTPSPKCLKNWKIYITKLTKMCLVYFQFLPLYIVHFLTKIYTMGIWLYEGEFFIWVVIGWLTLYHTIKPQSSTWMISNDWAKYDDGIRFFKGFFRCVWTKCWSQFLHGFIEVLLTFLHKKMLKRWIIKDAFQNILGILKLSLAKIMIFF